MAIWLAMVVQKGTKILCIPFSGPLLRLPCHGIVNEAMLAGVAPQDVVGPTCQIGFN